MKTYLRDYRLYERQIERLHKKYLFTPKIYELQQDEVSLASIVLNARKVAKLIAKTVERREYEFKPAIIREICIKGKVRQVFSLRITDFIVHSAIAEIIQDAMAARLSPRLYSYRKGVSWWIAVSDFASYIRAYRKRTPDPRLRGLYVLRRDLESYTDTIPVGQNSKVWQMLRDVLESSEKTASILPMHWDLIEKVVRPEVQTKEEGSHFCRILGVPTGQPISCVLFNLYASELDRELDTIPEAFYARYSDDILFTHHNIDVLKTVEPKIEEILSGLGLKVNPEKSRNLYLTAAGRQSSDWNESKGTTFVSFLGYRVWADGTISLDRRKVRNLLRDLYRRAIRTAKAMNGRDLDHKGQLVCSVINKALESDTTGFQNHYASLLRKAVTNRSQLAELDYWIARIVLRAVIGKRGVRAFREIPYRKIRGDWGLISLLHSRNKWR